MTAVEPTSQATTLYDVLGVADNASVTEIKRAYYALVRAQGPVRDPERFQKLTEAGTILTDYRRRGEYDQQRRSGKRVQILLDQAAAALERDNQHAISLLKSAIALAPDMLRPRHLLAHVLMKVEEYSGAEKQYRWLLKELPRDETLHYKLARCLHLQNRLTDAERQLETALRFNPCYHDALMLISRIYEDSNQYDLARDALEKAIANDARENYADVDALLRLIILSLQADHEAYIDPLIERFLGVLPDGKTDDDVEKATRAVMKVLARANELFEAQRYPVVTRILSIAERIGNAADEVLAEVRNQARWTLLTAETRHMETDPLLCQPIKEIFYVKYLDQTGEAQRQSRLDEIMMTLSTEIIRDARRIGNNLEYLRREYPLVSEDHAAVLQTLSERVAKRLAALDSSNDTAVMPAASTPDLPPEKPRKKGIFALFQGKKK